MLVESITRALQILELLSDAPQGATLTRLVNSIRVGKSAVSRILATLERDGYVVREPNGEVFKISLRFAGMALRHIERVGVVEACMPALRKLADETGELVQLAVVTGDLVMYVAKAAGGRRIQAIPLIGTSAELHASAAGKLWLASLDEEKAIRLALNAGLRKITDRTVSSITALQKDLSLVRKNGFATVARELSEDMNAMAFPVLHTRTGKLIGSVVLAVPAYRTTMEQLVNLGPKVRACAEQLQEMLTAYSHTPPPEPADSTSATVGAAI